jgi:beta-phosphoglucomutase-like phosphatase (HAD superfamily)
MSAQDPGDRAEDESAPPPGAAAPEQGRALPREAGDGTPPAEGRHFLAAIFDMDGLLIDSERATSEAWIAGAKALGFKLEMADFLGVVGRAAQQSVPMLIEMLGSEEAMRATAAKVRELLPQSGGGPVFPLKPGALMLLEALRHAGIPCGVASSSDVDEIRHRLGHVGVLGYFRSVTGGNEVAHGKPDPAIYLLAASRLGVLPAECIAFEDSENGARAAQAAGIRVVIVPDLKHPPEDVAAHAHAVIDSLADAIAHVPHWFPRL